MPASVWTVARYLGQKTWTDSTMTCTCAVLIRSFGLWMRFSSSSHATSIAFETVPFFA